MEKSEKKLSLNQIRTDLLGLIPEISGKMSLNEQEEIDISIGVKALSEMFLRHTKYYFLFNLGDICKYFSAIDLTIDNQQKEIKRLEETLKEEKERHEIILDEEKYIRHYGD